MLLNLILKTKWFDMIKSGEKTEEYRDVKPFYISRFFIPGDLLYHKQYNGLSVKEFTISKLKEKINSINNETLRYKPFKYVKFHKGYTNETMTFEIDDIKIGYGQEKWGAEKDKEYFVIKLGKRIN